MRGSFAARQEARWGRKGEKQEAVRCGLREKQLSVTGHVLRCPENEADTVDIDKLPAKLGKDHSTGEEA